MKAHAREAVCNEINGLRQDNDRPRSDAVKAVEHFKV